LSIQDAPRYPWRGLLIDSSRHYLSVPLLKRTVDTMASMKLNTLHWHIVDAESFPFVSAAYPELQNKATFHPTASYSPQIIADLVVYARDRGVRIVPEFDTPGHNAAVGQAYPELIADCYAWLEEHYNSDLRWSMWDAVALDVTREDTHTFVKNVLTEMSALFTDEFFHIGGDEVNQGCWNAVPSILTYMQQNGFATYNAANDTWVYDFTGLQNEWTSFV
jgi:hexosaminidase